jgi:serine/threonine-protein kinase CTR1
VEIHGEHYVVDLVYEPAQLYPEASRSAMHYNRGRRGSPKQTGLTNLPARDVREIPWDELSNVRILRDGGFGRVQIAQWRGMDVVIKVPLTSDSYVIKTFQEEARVLNALSHPNIVQLLGVCSPHKAIILEYINGGDVHTWLKTKKLHELSLKERLDVLVQAAIGMQYLHGCEPPIVHRDLKTLNLLIHSTIYYNEAHQKIEKRVIKVCDFGLARNQKSTAGISTQHKDMGTPAYQSPEQWRDDDEERLTAKTDCYSFGGIILEVLTDKIPWHEEKSKYAIYQHVVVERRSPPIPPTSFQIPKPLIDLIRWCHAYEPRDRPSFPEILRVLRDVDDSLPPEA